MIWGFLFCRIYHAKDSRGSGASNSFYSFKISTSGFSPPIIKAAIPNVKMR